MQNINVGDTVKRADADDPRSIPAYRNMRGKVVDVSAYYARVEWSCDKGLPATVVHVDDLVRA